MFIIQKQIIFYIFYCNFSTKVTLAFLLPWIGYCYPCVENHFKLCLQSLRYFLSKCKYIKRWLCLCRCLSNKLYNQYLRKQNRWKIWYMEHRRLQRYGKIFRRFRDLILKQDISLLRDFLSVEKKDNF